MKYDPYLYVVDGHAWVTTLYMYDCVYIPVLGRRDPGTIWRIYRRDVYGARFYPRCLHNPFPVPAVSVWGNTPRNRELTTAKQVGKGKQINQEFVHPHPPPPKKKYILYITPSFKMFGFFFCNIYNNFFQVSLILTCPEPLYWHSFTLHVHILDLSSLISDLWPWLDYNLTSSQLDLTPDHMTWTHLDLIPYMFLLKNIPDLYLTFIF